MRFLLHAAITLLILALVAGAAGFALTRNGLSARSEPPAIEAAVARRIRSLAIPTGAKARLSPYRSDGQAWLGGGRLFQDQCAVCHGDDGSGKSTIGRNLYPKAPDMRASATQALTDGELYFIITNGIRYTGMPGWEGEHTPAEVWRLVAFVRRLPRLTSDDQERLHDDPSAGRDE
jgi:mono/diheme cytochrome c family protein